MPTNSHPEQTSEVRDWSLSSLWSVSVRLWHHAGMGTALKPPGRAERTLLVTATTLEEAAKRAIAVSWDRSIYRDCELRRIEKLDYVYTANVERSS